jgi:WD40 repeat protein
MGEALTGVPEEVMWSPSGGSVLVSTINDNLNTAEVSEVIAETGERRDFPLPGPIRAFHASPDESLLATVHEEGRERVLRVWDTAVKTAEDVHRDTRNLYFPLVNTVDPWDPSSERLIFYRARLHERHLMIWEAAKGEVREVTSERRSDRAFWDQEGKLLIPQGVPFEAVLSGKPNTLTGLMVIDFAEEREVLRQLPAEYPNIFPYSRTGVAILKDEMVPPLLLDLSTWATSRLPGSVDRFLDVTWSPDGSGLAYPLNGRGSNRIVTFDVESGESRLLWVDEEFLAGSLDWSPSGEYLAVSLLASKGPPEGQAIVMEADTGEQVWSRARNPDFIRRYFHRGRKSLCWHPTEDTLLLWDPVGNPDGPPGLALRAVEFGQ